MEKAKIESKYNFNQTVYILDGMYIREGKVMAIKGEVRYTNAPPHIELQIECCSGDVCAHIWVKEENCAEKSEMITNKILHNSKLPDIE